MPLQGNNRTQSGAGLTLVAICCFRALSGGGTAKSLHACRAGTIRHAPGCRRPSEGGAFYWLFLLEGNALINNCLGCFYDVLPFFYACSFCNLPSHCYKAKSARIVKSATLMLMALCTAVIECVR